MQGGLFGLSTGQRIYLYLIQIIPTFIFLLIPGLIESFFTTQVFYLVSTYIYIQFFSIQKSYYPYLFNQLNRVKWQIHKGMILGFSAFLLIIIYGTLFFKLGRFVLPHSINLGHRLNNQWWTFLILCLTNPIIEQWFWRLFLQKSFQETFYKTHVTNVAYLMLHFALLTRYVGLFRAIPLIGTFFSLGRSMKHIKQKYGIFSAVISHYGVSLGGFGLYLYIKTTTSIFI